MHGMSRSELKNLVEKAGFEWEKDIRPDKKQGGLISIETALDHIEELMQENGIKCEGLTTTIDYAKIKIKNLLGEPIVRYAPRHQSMSWWHAGAISFSYFLAQKAGVYCFTELHERNTGARADCFIIPTESNPNGLVVQWELEENKNLQRTYMKTPFFPRTSEVVVLSYDKLWDDLYGLREYDYHYEDFLSNWATRHQLPYPKKYSWYKYRKQRGDVK